MFLGIKIDKREDGIIMSQKTYLENLLKKFGMNECKPINTPMELNYREVENDERLHEKVPYRELIGCFLYVTQTTRPDLSYAVNYFSHYQSDPKESHWKGLKRILHYIQGTVNYGMHYKNEGENGTVIAYADSDWAKSSDRKSTTGYVIKLFGNTISWGSKKPTTVALSSTEAEFISLATCAAEYLWFEKLFQDLKILKNEKLVIYEDNQSCISSLCKWEYKRLKHIDVKYAFVRDLCLKKIIDNTLLQKIS